jgi:hypothetical protein
VAAFDRFDGPDRPRHTRLPNEISEGCPAVIAACDTHLQRGTCLADATVPECLKQPIEKDLCLALLVTSQVLTRY